MNTGVGFHGENWEDDGHLFYVDDLELDSLRVHIGPVFSGNDVAKENGIWLELIQRNDERTELTEEYFLLSKSTFDALVEYVKRGFE